MFWEIKEEFLNNSIIIEAEKERIIKYSEFREDCHRLTEKLKSSAKKLIFIFCDQDYHTILSYVSALNSGNAVFLAESKLNPRLKESLIEIYKPEIIFDSSVKDYRGYKKNNSDSLVYFISDALPGGEVNEQLAVLLSTSGTTGSPKSVRLSYENIQSNAEAIADYLHLDETERPVSSLPFSYSYGLSVLNSHLLTGASIVLTNKTFVLRDFWKTFNKYECTSFAGVPYTYQLLKKTNFHRIDLPSLKYLTQAGGALDKNTLEYFVEYADKNDVSFFTMYGQTEASPRISYVLPERLSEKIGSIGKPIPGGSIHLYRDNEIINESFTDGEIVYSGKNVMMGYAESRPDLAKGDEMNGELRTGDLAYRDNDGYYFITGRLKRFIKIFGLRLNLDDIEKELERHFSRTIACTGEDNILSVYIEGQIDKHAEKELKEHIIKTYDLNMKTIQVRFIDKMLFTSNGKKDYKRLTKTVT